MGSQTTTTTEETSTAVNPAQGQELAMRNLMARLAEQGVGQLGDLSALTSGQMQVTDADADFIRQISELTGQMQRDQARGSFEEMSGAVEDQLLSRGLEGSSIEAVNQALLGRQLQQSMDQGALQQQATSAQQLQQMPFQRGQMQLGANQLLLQQILGGAGQVAGMGLQERLAQTTTRGTGTQTKPFDWAGTAMQLGGMAANIAFPPTAAATTAGKLAGTAV